VTLEIRPITFDVTKDFIARHHRHLGPVRFWKFGVGATIDDRLVGVIVVAHPAARGLNDGYTAEVARLATDGTRNACSKLYGAVARICREMGYRKLVTYTLDSEHGKSLEASGWTMTAMTQGNREWSCHARRRSPSAQTCVKKRWEKPLFKIIPKSSLTTADENGGITDDC
jgi:GNAT superfamily N-acetyltransferase